MKRRTQMMQVLSMLLESDSITPWDVIRETGCYKLSTRIGELRKRGHRIVGTRITRVNKHGEEIRFMSYSMEKKA